MFSSINKLFGTRPPPKSAPMMTEPVDDLVVPLSRGPQKLATYAKVFRWRLPDGQTQAPASVEIVGTFNHWQPTAMTRDSALDAWHVTMHHIPGGRTHHYMFLVDGQPAYDKNCDGLAIPNGPQEEGFAFTTTRGPRVYMLFGQAK